MSTLNLPDGARVAVWRLVKARLRDDAGLSAAGVALVFFDNGDDRGPTKSLDEYGGNAAVRFLCTLGSMSWWDERSQSGALVVSYETWVRSLDDEDALNLQEALESALYPDDGFAFHEALITAGATTGQPRFSVPLTQALAAAGRDGAIRPTGQFVIEVERGFPV